MQNEGDAKTVFRGTYYVPGSQWRNDRSRISLDLNQAQWISLYFIFFCGHVRVGITIIILYRISSVRRWRTSSNGVLYLDHCCVLPPNDVCSIENTTQTRFNNGTIVLYHTVNLNTILKQLFSIENYVCLIGIHVTLMNKKNLIQI